MQKILRYAILSLLTGVLIYFIFLLASLLFYSKYGGEERELVEIDYNNLRNGDIIFQVSQSSQSKAIQLATGSKYSHMGIIYENDHGFFVFEAIQPVKLTPLRSWIDRGEKGHYVIKRLVNADEVLDAETLSKMKEIGEKYMNKDYDIYFEWSNDRIYCSELVWKIYKEAIDVEIGQLQELREFNLSDKAVKQKMQDRYGAKIPLDEKVISPGAMFDSELLLTVIEK